MSGLSLPPVQRSTRERVWHAMRVHQGAWTIYDLAAEAEAPLNFVKSFTNRLMKVQYVRQVKIGRGGLRSAFLLAQNTGPKAPTLGRNGRLVDRNLPSNSVHHTQLIWSAIRKYKTFEIADIRAETRLPDSTIHEYVKGLTDAGFIERLAAPVPDAHALTGQWCLTNDAGPIAPTIQKRRYRKGKSQ